VIRGCIPKNSWSMDLTFQRCLKRQLAIAVHGRASGLGRFTHSYRQGSQAALAATYRVLEKAGVELIQSR